MISYSPTYLVLRETNKELMVRISSEYKNYTFELIALPAASSTIKPVICGIIPVTIKKAEKAETPIKVDTAELTRAMQSCETQYKQFAIRITPIIHKASTLAAKEQLYIPILRIGKEDHLSNNNRAAVLGEITRTIYMTDLTCSPTIVYDQRVITCSAALTNDTDTPIIAYVTATVRNDFFNAITVQQQSIATNVLLEPAEQYPVSFSIPQRDQNIGRFIIEASTAFTPIESTAAAYIVSKASTHYYLPIALLYGLCIAALVTSAILIRKLLTKFTARHRVRKQ